MEDKIDLVILDHTFKNSKLQGIDILPELKQVRNVVVVLSSGYPEHYFKENYPQEVLAQVNGYINKMYSSPDFVSTLENIYNHSR